MWGAAPRPGRGRALSREQNARQAGDRRNSCTTRKPNFQASKLPNFHFPLYPRHVCDVPTSTQRAGRACTQSTRSARRTKRAWRASHATLLGSWESSGVSRCPSCPIGPICPTAKFDDVSRRVKREADGREGAISGRLVRKATGVSPSDFAHTGVFAGSFSFPSQCTGGCSTWNTPAQTLIFLLVPSPTLP